MDVEKKRSIVYRMKNFLTSLEYFEAIEDSGGSVDAIIRRLPVSTTLFPVPGARLHACALWRRRLR